MPSSERETIEGAVGGARPEGPSALTESGRSTPTARAPNRYGADAGCVAVADGLAELAFLRWAASLSDGVGLGLRLL